MWNGLKTNDILCGISLNLDKNILQTAYPLLEEGEIEIVEWSFDALYSLEEVPKWFHQLILAYSDAGRLLGHGIFYSLFSGKMSNAQKKWLYYLEKISQRYNFSHISEHFGFMSGKDFHSGAPLSIPYNENTLNIARNRIQWLSHHAKVPVGLENLAFAFTEKDVNAHGKFLEEILQPVNGFIILDLHNIYCQVENFKIPFEKIIRLIPLHLVREIHISGGSWENSYSDPSAQIRRDTHDDRVPHQVFQYLQKIIPQSPNLKYVILEQLGTALDTEVDQAGFQEDFRMMNEIVKNTIIHSVLDTNNFNASFKAPKSYLENQRLQEEQNILSEILETSTSFSETKERLLGSNLANSSWNIESWQDTMLETAWSISRKWKADESSKRE